MEKFESEINKLNEDVEFTTWLSAEEDARKVNNTLIVNAKDEGKQENQIKAVKNLLSKGMKIDRRLDKEKAIKKYIEKGPKDIKIETAKKMLEKNMKLEYIIDITEISKDELQKIEDNL